MIEIARAFGNSLDEDDFNRCKQLLSSNCTYKIGGETLIGPEAIVQSYETNMIEGRKKLDQLKWGQSFIEEIETGKFYVHFTDYLTHNGRKHTHKCKQSLTVSENLITRIFHVHDDREHQALQAFYKSVGLPNSLEP